MTTTTRRILIAATVHPHSMRFAYRNTATGAWTLVDWKQPTDRWTDDFRNWTSSTFLECADAVAALVSEFGEFDRTNVFDVEDSTTNLRRVMTSLYDLVCDLGDDGEIADYADVLTQIRLHPGMTMSGQRAHRELQERADRAVLLPDPLTASTEDFGFGIIPALDEPLVDDAVTAPPITLRDGSRYWPRELFGSTDVDVLRRVRGTAHARLSGPPGAGKTSLVDAAFGDDVITVQGHPDLTVASLYGQYLPSRGDAAWEWFDGPLVRSMRDGAVLLVDEINRAPADVDDALLSATDARASIVISDRPDLPPVVAAPGFMVIATSNDADRGTRPLSAGLLRRLNVHVRVETDFATARAEGIDPQLLHVARNLRTSATAVSHARGGAPIWWPQLADLRGAQNLMPLGAQAAFTALTASCDQPERRHEAHTVFSSVFEAQVLPTTALGAGAIDWTTLDALS